jgi:ectoine hydroxylase-related dioxygenase (phytanoyl-CoA dioxygenase family)
MLGGEEVLRFHEQGYLGPFALCTPPAMAAVRELIDREVLGRPGPAGNTGHFRHLDSRVVFDLCAHPAIVERMASILGPHLLLWRSAFFVKAPGGAEIPWHQDGQYWAIEPPVNISAWVAIDEATVENSCVQLIPGSHTAVIPHIPTSEQMEAGFGKMADPALVDTSRVVDMELRPGEFFLFNERVVHRSAANRSDRRRLGLSMRVTVPFVRVDHRRFFAGYGVVVLRGEDYMGFNQTAVPPLA